MEKTKKSLFGPMDLTKGTCWKTILIFSLPVILSYLLQQVYSISDAAIVGQTLTAQEVAGVNDTTSLVFIFLQFAFGVSAGFCVVTSCQVGARNQAGVRRSLATQIVLSAVLTVLLTATAFAGDNDFRCWTVDARQWTNQGYQSEKDGVWYLFLPQDESPADTVLSLQRQGDGGLRWRPGPGGRHPDRGLRRP